MKKIISILSICFILGSCTVYKYLPSETVVEKRDSIVYKVDTLKIDVPVEVIKEVVPSVDTLKMETSIAEAVAYLDSATTTLKGSLKNKKTYLQQPQIVYKERISYRDSVRIVKEPYPVEKIKKVAPVWAWYTLVFSLLVICYIAFRIYLLIYRPKT